jgi:hypothetical protein
MLSVLLLRSAFCMWSVAPGPIVAVGSGEGDETKVSVTVVSILATTQDDHIDEKLNDVAREVRKKMPEFTGFRIATTTCLPVPIGGKKGFPTVDDQEVTVEAKVCTDKSDRFCLQVKAPTLQSLTYTCVGGKYFPIVTGYETKKSERLIIAVMVEKPKGK